MMTTSAASTGLDPSVTLTVNPVPGFARTWTVAVSVDVSAPRLMVSVTVRSQAQAL